MPPGVYRFENIADPLRCSAAQCNGSLFQCNRRSIVKHGVRSHFCGVHYVPPANMRCICLNNNGSRCSHVKVNIQLLPTGSHAEDYSPVYCDVSLINNNLIDSDRSFGYCTKCFDRMKLIF